MTKAEMISTLAEKNELTKAMPENNLLEDIIPIDKKFKIC